MSYKSLPCLERWYGVLAVLGVGLLDFLLLSWLIGRPVTGLSFVLGVFVLASVLAMGYVGYRTLATFNLEYWVDRNAVTLVWGPTRQVIPIGSIQRLIVGSDASVHSKSKPWHWPCPDRRRLVCEGLGVVNSYAARPLAEQIILVTSGESYGVSPVDAPGFLTALQERVALGPARAVEAALRRPPLWTWPLWRDRGALVLMGAGLLGILVMFGVLCFRFPYLSSDLPLHFDISGLPDRIAPKSGLFALPLIGLVTWLFNTGAGVWLYRRIQRGAAYLLWGGAMVVQGIAGLALFNLMRW